METLRIRADGRVERLGIEQAPSPIVAASYAGWRQDTGANVLVLKVAGTHHWTGRGMPAAYSGGEYQIFEVVDDEGDTVRARLIASFPVRNAPAVDLVDTKARVERLDEDRRAAAAGRTAGR